MKPAQNIDFWSQYVLHHSCTAGIPCYQTVKSPNPDLKRTMIFKTKVIRLYQHFGIWLNNRVVFFFFDFVFPSHLGISAKTSLNMREMWSAVLLKCSYPYSLDYCKKQLLSTSTQSKTSIRWKGWYMFKLWVKISIMTNE